VANFWKKLPVPFLALAPMQDVTDFVFREIISGTAKPDVMFTEFTNVDAIFSKGHNKAVQRLRYSEKQRPIVAQLWGINPENFYKSAKLLKELKFDGIDINMGCPDKAVVSRGAGAALIKNQTLAKEIIAAVKDGARNLPVSVKTRIGFDQIVTEDWISFLLEQKINALTVHVRLAKEKFKGEAQWDEMLRVVSLKNKISPDTVIIGNGDIKSYKEALCKYKKYNVDGVMIGRGIFSNPWMFENISPTKAHETREYLDQFLKHAKMYSEEWGSTKNYEIMKKFVSMYINRFKGSAAVRNKIMLCKTYLQMKEVIKDWVLSAEI